MYVANQNSNNVTVIDGATNSTSHRAPGSARRVAVTRYQQDLRRQCWQQQHDGDRWATNTSSLLRPPGRSLAVAVNPVTNKIYVANNDGNNMT